MKAKNDKPSGPAATSELPADLDRALSDAERVLAERDSAYSILAATHTAIPQLLRERIEASQALGAAELTGTDTDSARDRLTEIEGRRQASVRARQAAIDKLTAGEFALGNARARVAIGLEEYAGTALVDFERRYADCIENLRSLWREGLALSASLRTAVPMPDPMKIVGVEVVDEKYDFGQAIVQDPSKIRLERIMSDVTVTPPAIDETARRLGVVLDRLDHAVGFCRNVSSQEQRLRSLRPLPSADFAPNGLFVVTRTAMVDPVSGLRWEPGVLIDATLVNVTVLSRAYFSKSVAMVPMVSVSRPVVGAVA